MAACAPTAAGYATLGTIPSVNATNVQEFQKYAGTASVQGSPTDTSCPSPVTVGGTPVAIGAVGFSGANYNKWLTAVESVDWNISSSDQLRVRYAYSKNNQTDNLGDNGQGYSLPAFWTILPQRFHLFTLGEYHTFTPNLTNEFRLVFGAQIDLLPSLVVYASLSSGVLTLTLVAICGGLWIDVAAFEKICADRE